MKSKDFDDFSFKAPQSEQSLGEISYKEESILEMRDPQPPKEIRYRHLQQNQKPGAIIFDRQINKKIDEISQELEQNIKRRLQLEKKLNVVQKEEMNKEQREVFMAYNNNSYKSGQEEAKEYDRMNRRADQIDRRIKDNKNMGSNKEQIVEKNKEILLDYEEPVLSEKEQIIIPIIQHLSSKPKPLPVYTLPDQIKIQKFLLRTTFPQIPKGSLQQLKRQIQGLYSVHSPHSDIHYLLMVIYFHLKRFMKVRKNFEEIVNFKTFNAKAYWIAAESEFQMKNYDLCLKLTEDCMNKLPQKCLPRFIYLKAKSYEQLGNYVNSVICFNQLIKMKPKISEYYLERGIIYHRIGYYKQSKQDFVTFGIMRPDAQDHIKQKVLTERNEHRKREYIALLAKMF